MLLSVFGHWKVRKLVFLELEGLFFISGGSGATIKAHKAAVTGISYHPLGQYVLSSSKDQTWAFSDIESGKFLLPSSLLLIIKFQEVC